MGREVLALLDSRKSILVGVIFIALGLVFEGRITDVGGDMAQTIILALGAILTAYGLYLKVNSDDADDNLSEEELRNKIILHTLARMTNADFNIMNVEVESVQNTYKEITGGEVTTKDVRVAALGELHEERPFCSYLSKQEGRISTANKVKIMTALSKIMKSDGVVNPLEVEFFNKVGKCLNIKAADMLDL